MLTKRLGQGSDLGAILQIAWIIFKKYRKLFVLIALIVWLLIVIVGKYILVYLPAISDLFVDLSMGAQPNPLVIRQLISQAKLGGPELLAMVIILACIVLILHISVVKLTAMSIDGTTIARKKFVSSSRGRVLPLIGTYLVSRIFLVVLFTLLIIPGIIFSIYRTFGNTVTILGGVRGWNALKQSKFLVIGRRRRTLWIAFSIVIIVSISKELISAAMVFITRDYLSFTQIGSLDLLIEILFVVIGFIITTVFYHRWKITVSTTKNTQDLKGVEHK